MCVCVYAFCLFISSLFVTCSLLIMKQVVSMLRVLICISERWILTLLTLVTWAYYWSLDFSLDLFHVFCLLLCSQETRHTTIVAEIEDDSTFISNWTYAHACRICDCVQLERWWWIIHSSYTREENRERKRDARERVRNVHWTK